MIIISESTKEPFKGKLNRLPNNDSASQPCPGASSGGKVPWRGDG